MKNKIIILIAISAAVTLSFTFASKRSTTSAKSELSNKAADQAPIGGFALEDKL